MINISFRRLYSTTVVFTILFFLFSGCSNPSDSITSLATKPGIQFNKLNWSQAIEQSQKEQKPIFLFAHANYCSSCKEMISTVLPEKEVGEIFNQHFINKEVDIESEEGKKLVTDFEITGTPTLLFLHPDGKIIKKVSGFQNKQELIDLTKGIEK